MYENRARALHGLTAVIAALIAGCAAAPEDTPEGADAEMQVAAIESVLVAQQQAWNSGDLDAFMDGYWQSDSLRFASGGRVRYGWQPTLDGYRRGYPDRATMGTLTFDSLSVHLLTSEDAYVFGRWSLARDSSFAPASGLFTLIFQRLPQGWRVVHDHTSSAN